MSEGKANSVEPEEERENLVARLSALWRNERLQFTLLVIAGLIAWIVIYRAYPLRPVVPRYAEF